MAPEKTVGPLTTLAFVSIELDTVLMEASLPQEKLDKCWDLLSAFLRRCKVALNYPVTHLRQHTQEKTGKRIRLGIFNENERPKASRRPQAERKRPKQILQKKEEVARGEWQRRQTIMEQ